ncbi:arylsulfatase B [Eupeodes corollae]|uniref:arylsulfatase B n=1 Tax=Eupeodes corollae TaxID=290404 RepID=UPI00248F6FFD|nr:arylsulfatase B [Eupeodes corollae]XP_055906141.1 arylsulfatase B [Eupeodes corollae]XP_055906142.1 arylsulfatase B [Eupeodes corollae]
MKLPSLMTMTTMMMTMALIGLTYANSNQKHFKPPNIVILMADDMGIDDVSFHGQKQHITPNIDALAYHGRMLNHLYTPPMCTPSRSALMTGKYPFHTGTQHFVIGNEEPWGLPLNFTTIAEVFNEAGYATNLIGKWHLGFSEKEYLPTYRGFDSHYGYLGGFIDYYQRMALMPLPNASIGYDFRRNLDIDCDMEGTYMTDLLTTEAETVIENHDTETPLFLMVNHLAPHTGNDFEPLQAPENDIEKFKYIQDEKRRIYAAMVAKLDESIGNITRALDKKDLLKNTILIFYSDNGAPSIGLFSNTGSNYPMRGQKNTPWEGGSRVAGAIWSPLLKNRKSVFNQKMSAVDWLPTLASAADIQLDPELNVDGLDLWEELSCGITKPFNRDIIHVLDPISNVVSIISDGFKYINGTTINGQFDGVLTTRGEEVDPRDSDYANTVLNSLSSQILAKYDSVPLTEGAINALRSEGEIKCLNPKEKASCNPLKEECLFKIDEDPCEENNLADDPEFESILSEIRTTIDIYRLSALKPANKASLPDGDPSVHDCIWTWFVESPTTEKNSHCSYQNAPCQRY